MTDTTLEVGNVLKLTFGPFVATAEVVEIRDEGAVLELNNDARLVGYDSPDRAPNGNVLTTSPFHTFLGRAHFAAADVIYSVGSRAES